MRREFKLPDVGEGLTEAEIVRWHVTPGDPVRINQTIVEIETAKAVVELPCPFEGTVAALLAEEGSGVAVGTPIIAVDTVEEPGTEPGTASRPEALAEDMVPPPAPEPEQRREPVLVGYGVKPGAARRRPRKRPTAPPGSGAPPSPAPGRAVSGTAVLAKPPVRKLAKDLGVDLSALTGTGPHGTITRDDVHAAASHAAAPAAREERIPVKGVRRAMAQAMVASAFGAPHVTEFLQIDASGTVAAVRRLRELPDFADVKVSPLLMAAKALLVAVRRHPMINSSWDERAGEIVVRPRVNLGIAAATPRGLLVPTIKDAQALSLVELARALNELTESARAGRSRPEDMTGGTITITNVGVFGVDAGTPILNPGEAAILALGQIRDLPWVVDGQVVPRKVCTLALSFDHRIVDGELGSMFLADIGAMLEDPLRVLAWS